jgi:hypothetical protein
MMVNFDLFSNEEFLSRRTRSVGLTPSFPLSRCERGMPTTSGEGLPWLVGGLGERPDEMVC